MKSIYFKFALVLSFISAGCAVQPKAMQDMTRLPQSSMYEQAEVLSDDLDTEDALVLEENNNDKDKDKDKQNKPNSSLYFSICHEPKVQEFKVSDRVVTRVEGQFVSGTLKESYEQGKIFIVATDYGPVSTLRKAASYKRNSDEISKAFDCDGVKSKKVYGLFKVSDKYYTGHVREVYKNGIVRFVNDRFKEQFSSIDESYLEIVGSKLKGKAVLFARDGKQIRADIRRVFEKDILLVKDGKTLSIRKANEVAVQD